MHNRPFLGEERWREHIFDRRVSKEFEALQREYRFHGRFLFVLGALLGALITYVL